MHCYHRAEVGWQERSQSRFWPTYSIGLTWAFYFKLDFFFFFFHLLNPLNAALQEPTECAHS